MTPAEPQPALSPKELGGLLRRAMNRGIPYLDAQKFAGLFALRTVELATVHDDDSGRRAALASVLQDLAGDLYVRRDRGVANFALRLSDDVPDGSLKDRLIAGADVIGVEYETSRKYLTPVANLLANRLHELEAWNLRFNAEGDEYNPEHVAEHLAKRFDFYHFMAFHIGSAARDLSDMSRYIAHGDIRTAEELAETAFWRLVKYTRTVNRFRDAFSTWILSSPAATRALERKTEILHQYQPPIQADVDHLATVAQSTLSNDRRQILELAHEDPKGKRALRQWREWALSCTCEKSRSASKRCEVHLWIDAASGLYHLIEDDYEEVYVPRRFAPLLTYPDPLI
jgi:hypothetical protein